MKKILFFLAALFLFNNVYGQDYPFQLPMNGALQANPAFIGHDSTSQAGISFRGHKVANLQTSAIGSYVFGFIPKTNSYLGMSFTWSQFSNGAVNVLNNTTTYLHIGQNIALADEVFFRVGVQAGLIQRRLNRNQITYGDLIDLERGFIFTTQDRLKSDVLASTWGFGAMLYIKRFILAGSVGNINRPNISLIEGTSFLERKWQGSLSYDLHIGSPRTFHVQPFLAYSEQMDFRVFGYGTNLKWRSIQLGARYNGVSLDSGNIIWLGYQGKKLGITLSRYQYISKYSTKKQSGFEMMASYRFWKQKTQRRLKTISEGIYW